MKSLRDLFDRLPNYTKSYYFIFIVLFLIWMAFFDSNDIYSQFKLRSKLKDIEAQKEYYIEKIEEVKKDREELFSNKELLEKFAREKYLMKKKEEDIYIIVED
jgi:cell division protein FtsB